MCQFATYRPILPLLYQYLLCSPSLTLNIPIPSRFWRIIPAPPPPPHWSRLSFNPKSTHFFCSIFAYFHLKNFNVASWILINRRGSNPCWPPPPPPPSSFTIQLSRLWLFKMPLEPGKTHISFFFFRKRSAEDGGGGGAGLNLPISYR